MEKLAVAYLRVSDPTQVKNFSLDNQQDLIENKAEQEGYQIIKTFREEGESAKTTNRHKLQELIKFVTDPKSKISAVFVYKYDRLNRNSLEFQLLRQMFAKLGISIISATEVSGSTPEVAFVQNLLSAFSEFENSVKSQRVQQGLERRFREGYTSSRPHHGYERKIVDGRSLEVPKEPQFSFLQDCWKKIAYEYWTLAKIQRHIESSGLFKKLALQSIAEIFNETFYFGQLHSRKYGTAQGKHQPMIDEETFYQARAVIKGRTKVSIPKYKKLREELPLKGILICSECGSTLTGGASTGRNAKFFYYNCGKRDHKYFGINAGNVNKDFLNLLKKIKPKAKAIQFFEELIQEQYESEFKDLSASTKQVGQDIETAEKALKNLKTKHLQGLYADEEFSEMKEELKIQIFSKRQLLGEKKQDKAGVQEVLAFMRFYLRNLDKIFTKASLEGKLAIAGSIFPEGLVYNNNTFIEPSLGYCYRLNELYDQVYPTKYP